MMILSLRHDTPLPGEDSPDVLFMRRNVAVIERIR